MESASGGKVGIAHNMLIGDVGQSAAGGAISSELVKLMPIIYPNLFQELQ